MFEIAIDESGEMFFTEPVAEPPAEMAEDRIRLQIGKQAGGELQGELFHRRHNQISHFSNLTFSNFT